MTTYKIPYIEVLRQHEELRHERELLTRLLTHAKQNGIDDSITLFHENLEYCCVKMSELEQYARQMYGRNIR